MGIGFYRRYEGEARSNPDFIEDRRVVKWIIY